MRCIFLPKVTVSSQESWKDAKIVEIIHVIKLSWNIEIKNGFNTKKSNMSGIVLIIKQSINH